MRAFLILITTFFSLLFPLSLLAQVYVPPPPTPPPAHMHHINQMNMAPPVVPEKKDKVSIKNQYYELDHEGLRDYLESIRYDQSDLYSTMNPDMEQLETDEKTARYVRYGAFVVAGLLTVQGFMTFQSEARDAVDDPGSESSNNGSTMMTAGVVIAAIGVLIPNLIKPDKKDYLNFINKHNRQNPESPLQINASIKLDRPAVGLNMAYTF